MSRGISVSLKNSSLECFFLYGKYDKKYKVYAEALPFGITMDMTNSVSFFV